MVKVVEEFHYCDVCGAQIEGNVKPVPRAIREVGYWGDYRYTEYKNVHLCIKELELCKDCKYHSDTRLVAMVTEMGTDKVTYSWLR